MLSGRSIAPQSHQLPPGIRFWDMAGNITGEQLYDLG